MYSLMYKMTFSSIYCRKSVFMTLSKFQIFIKNILFTHLQGERCFWFRCTFAGSSLWRLYTHARTHTDDICEVRIVFAEKLNPRNKLFFILLFLVYCNSISYNIGSQNIHYFLKLMNTIGTSVCGSTEPRSSPNCEIF